MRTSPDPRQFTLNPAHYGLPTRADLVAMRIWDIHYHGLERGNLRRHKETQFYVERMGIERVLSLDIAGSQGDPLGRSVSAEAKREIRRFLEEHADRVSGLIPIDPGQPRESCRKMEEWIRDGPCVGIKYYGGNPQGVTCSHPNNDPIIELAAEPAGDHLHSHLDDRGRGSAAARRRQQRGRVDADGRGAAGRAVPQGAAHLRPLRRRLGAGRACGPATTQRLHRVQRLGSALRSGRLHGGPAGRRPADLGRARPEPLVLDRAVEGPRRRPQRYPAASDSRRQPAADQPHRSSAGKVIRWIREPRRRSRSRSSRGSSGISRFRGHHT